MDWQTATGGRSAAGRPVRFERSVRARSSGNSIKIAKQEGKPHEIATKANHASPYLVVVAMLERSADR